MKVAGFGFRRSASLSALEELLDRLRECYGPIDRLAASETMWPKVAELGKAHDLMVLRVPEASLPTAVTITHSSHSLKARGTGSVAEAVALVAAGPDAQLLGPRLVSGDRQATAAVAERSFS